MYAHIRVGVYVYKYALKKKFKTISYLLEGQEQGRQGILSALPQSQSNLGNSSNGNRVTLFYQIRIMVIDQRINKGPYF